ncbi:hypothetical protein, partial [Candidatus Pelagibacter sp. HIMB1746]|uniref:hypothetical protein n=1 Tax=Candidatus Pelagibacter sp. HIMB1746 TaxID=3413370 RepID=UPI003F845B5D
KFTDIKDINYSFTESLKTFKKQINKKIFLTSFNNNCEYYKNLKVVKKKYNSINYDILKKFDVILIEDIPINDFQSTIKNSFCNISSHAGYFVHTSLALKRKTIDIINEKDEKWLSAWIFNSNNYKIIYKSKNNIFFNINKILTKLNDEIR